MSVFAWIVIAFVVLLALLFVGGLTANARRRRETEGRYRDAVERSNLALAAAHAEDKGWAPEVVESAAREAFGAAHPGVPIDSLLLVQVVDLPGTDADQAVFKVLSSDREHTITLGRRDGAWVAVA